MMIRLRHNGKRRTTTKGDAAFRTKVDLVDLPQAVAADAVVGLRAPRGLVEGDADLEGLGLSGDRQYRYAEKSRACALRVSG